MSALRSRSEWALLAAFGGALFVFLAAPLGALVATASPSELLAGLYHPLVGPALRLSLFTTTTSLFVIVLLGTPLAWLFSRSQSRWVRLMETLTGLPVVIPPAVAGVALLLAFGRRGLFAGVLYPEGGSLAFSTGAVILAEIFVAAPIFLQAATSAFRRVDPDLIVVARSLGATPFTVLRGVALPMARSGVTAGAVMSWARALGEFGATLMFAGHLRGVTQTLPLAIYAALEEDIRVAQALSLVLVGVAFAVLVTARLLGDASRRTP